MTQDLDGQGYLHAAYVVETDVDGDGKLKILFILAWSAVSVSA